MGYGKIYQHSKQFAHRLKVENDFVSIALSPLDRFIHLGDEQWLAANSWYEYHITVGLLSQLSSPRVDAFWEDYELFAKDVLFKEIVLCGRFSSRGSSCFFLDESTVDRLGPIFKKWAPRMEWRCVSVHVSM